jgi:gliding motility-associated-like protein
VLHVNPTKKIQWYNDKGLIGGATQTSYRVSETGTYYALLVNSDGCSIATGNKDIVIDNPTPGVNYPVEYAVINLPFDLKARKFGKEVLWSPGTFLNTRTSYIPVFTGPSDQLYTIAIKTLGGCVTIDTQLVKTVEKADILVPTAFTPNGDGLNDFLRPVLFGIKQLNYFKIYNRLGTLIYQTATDRAGWDGTFKGVPQLSQVVVWIAEGIGADNKTYSRKGTSLLVR